MAWSMEKRICPASPRITSFSPSESPKQIRPGSSKAPLSIQRHDGRRAVESFGNVHRLAFRSQAVVEVLCREVYPEGKGVVVFVGKPRVDVFAQAADTHGQFGFEGDPLREFRQEKKDCPRAGCTSRV